MTQQSYLWENDQHIEVKYKQRLTRLAKACEAHQYDGVVFNAGLSLYYYFGLSFHLSERPITALISAAGKIVWVLPQFEAIQLEKWDQCSEKFCYAEDPQTWQVAFTAGWRALGVSDRAVIGFEVEQMRMLEYRFLQMAAPQAKFVEADRWIALQRACKDEGELELHRRAVQIAEQGFLARYLLFGWE
jgi:Xaa-Pro aminopeptidase